MNENNITSGDLVQFGMHKDKVGIVIRVWEAPELESILGSSAKTVAEVKWMNSLRSHIVAIDNLTVISKT
tara:strand:- start:970 stop:1179 length:210 start_codon:yes stop_codon:yes gene_type:complete